MSAQDIELSVVVGLISGKVGDLDRCLSALKEQENPPKIEILVPYDEPCRDVLSLAAKFPAVKFIAAPHLDTRAARAGASREHHDSLRTIGLKAASGKAVALTEDHAYATKTWCRDMVSLLEKHQNAAAVGGAVDCDNPSLFSWAIYWCDFGRYQNPLTEGPAAYVSDANVAYRREALESVRAHWESDYHETIVHDALQKTGKVLLLTPASEVRQARGKLAFFHALRERFVWARSYAGSRVATAPLARRLVLAAVSFLLPALLTFRIARGVFAKKRFIGKFIAALPFVLLLQSFWGLGEFVGYVTKDPGKLD